MIDDGTAVARLKRAADHQNPLIKIPKPSNREKKIAMAIDESSSDRREQRQVR